MGVKDKQLIKAALESVLPPSGAFFLNQAPFVGSIYLLLTNDRKVL